MEVRDYSICLGINNVSPAVRLIANQSKYELLDAINVYVTDRGSLRKRNGFTQVTNIPTTTVYSFNDILYRVTGQTLYANDTVVKNLDTPYIALTNDGEYLYFTDRVRTYRVIGANCELFLERGGQDITFANGSLWIASGSLLYFTIPYTGRIDYSRCVYPFPSYINLISSVGNVLYVSDTEHTYCMYPVENASYARKVVIDYPALRNSDVVIDGQIISQRISGDALLLATKNGLYCCLTTGDVMNLTPQYSFSEGSSATFLHRQKLYIY